MITDNRTILSKAPLLAMGILVLGFAACDPKPPQQATRDADQIIERAPSTAAGKEADPAKRDSKDVVGDGAASQPTKVADDVTLNIKVEDALKSNFTLKALPILVQTTEGVVTLSGSADTTANRNQAEQVAMNVQGVKSVQNKLVVSGT